jgi:hypothetical protein
MKRLVYLVVALALGLSASAALAGPPSCDERCSCEVPCWTLCSNPGTINCGIYGDCADLCRTSSVFADAASAPGGTACVAPALPLLEEATTKQDERQVPADTKKESLTDPAARG